MGWAAGQHGMAAWQYGMAAWQACGIGGEAAARG